MAFQSTELKSTKIERVSTSTPLPWWTWVLPFFIANLGTWLSLWFKTGPGASLWYLPTAFGIVMAYWWGPRVMLGVYLNAVVCAPLWDLPWQWSFLYALPETIEVGLSWLLFVKMAQGKYWLPDLRNVGRFLLFGSLAPTCIANIYLVTQLYFLKDITANAIWDNWQVLFSADLATQFVFAVPVLLLLTRPMSARGWTQVNDTITRLPLFPSDKNTTLDKTFMGAAFGITIITVSLFSVHDMRILYGFLLIYIAIRYGVTLAVLSSSWIGMLVFLLPVFLKGNLSLSTTYEDVLANNFDTLFLCAVTLITGRAISDLFTEAALQKQVENNLMVAEAKYRTLVEEVPPIIYIAAPNQHVGVTYISPRIELLGFQPNEWIADPQLWLTQMHPEDRTRVLQAVEESAESNQPFSSEYRLISRDGQVRWFLDEVLDIVDNEGKLIYRQGFMLDITARKLAEESLSRREQYLELLNKMTRTILLSSDFDSLFQTLAFDMKQIIAADDCYLLGWDAEQQLAIPITTTAKLDFDFAEATAEENQIRITASVLQLGHALVVEDTLNSPYIAAEIARQFPARSIIGVPLLAGGHKLGVAIIAFNSPHQFTQVELEQAEQAGNQVALALWDFQQSAEIQHRLRATDALARIARALSENERGGSGEVLQLIVDSARELMPHAEKSVIHLLDVEAQVLVARAVSGYGEAEKEGPRVNMRLGEGVAGAVIREGITINIGDITTHPSFIIGNSLPAFRSMLVAPVRSGSHQIGTISIQSVKTNAFSQQDADLLNALGLQASIAIENTRLLEATQKRLKEVNALYQISRGLAASLDANQLINEMVSLIQTTFDYYHVQIYLLEPQTGNLVVKHGSGYIGTELVEQHYFVPAGEGIVGHVAETSEPFITNNVDGVVFFKRNPLLPQTQTEIAVPIKVNQQVIGVLDIQNTLPARFTDDDFLLMIAIADQLAVALQRASLYANLQTALQQEQTIRSQLVQSERLALVGRLLASVSHELNNPLQAIQNALFLLKDEENLSAQGKQDLDVILSEAERMAALIERLRSAYRPIRIRDFQPVQINNTVEDVYALIATLMRHKEIAFEFFPDADLPPVPGISDQLRQVILNLFLNATEVMQPGGHLTVHTRNLPEQGEILITVTDTGPGIDPEILPQIFEPFVTSKHTGTGLGLTITHDIIEQHHGRIAADNSPNGGAIFSVWLPRE
jgi:PAS domain S-box-containing protein